MANILCEELQNLCQSLQNMPRVEGDDKWSDNWIGTEVLLKKPCITAILPTYLF